MHEIKRMMVGLDLSEMDDQLIRYAAFLSKQASVEKVVFMHVEKSIELPEDIIRSFSQPGDPIEETVRKLIEEKVLAHFNQLAHVQVEVLVVEGIPVRELLSWSKEDQTDLIIVGRKKQLRRTGILPQKLLRNGRTSVLFITENAKPVLNRIMVSTDFSDYATMAVDQLLHTALNQPEMEVVCLHAFEMPSRYTTLGYNPSEIETQIRAFARQRFEWILELYPVLRPKATLRLLKQVAGANIGELIAKEAEKAEADLLVVGAKGKSAAALFILGSVTEKVTRFNDTVPLLVFKRKNEEFGLVDALFYSNE